MAHPLSSGIFLWFMLLATLERDFKAISCRSQKEIPQLASPTWFCLLSLHVIPQSASLGHLAVQLQVFFCAINLLLWIKVMRNGLSGAIPFVQWATV